MIDNEKLPEKMSDKDKLAFARSVMGAKKVNSESPAHIHITALPDGVGHKVVLHEKGEDSEHSFEGNGSHHAVAEFVREALHSSENGPSPEHGFSAPTEKPGSTQRKPSGQFERYGENNL